MPEITAPKPPLTWSTRVRAARALHTSCHALRGERGPRLQRPRGPRGPGRRGHTSARTMGPFRPSGGDCSDASDFRSAEEGTRDGQGSICTGGYDRGITNPERRRDKGTTGTRGSHGGSDEGRGRGHYNARGRGSVQKCGNKGTRNSLDTPLTSAPAPLPQAEADTDLATEPSAEREAETEAGAKSIALGRDRGRAETNTQAHTHRERERETETVPNAETEPALIPASAPHPDHCPRLMRAGGNGRGRQGRGSTLEHTCSETVAGICAKVPKELLQRRT